MRGNSISQKASRAIFDDALDAYHNPSHPCHVFRDLQPVYHPGDDPTWILPVPFLGATATRGLVFLGLNPSYDNSPKDTDPRIGSSFEEWDRWARDYFDTEPQPWARLYRLYQAIGVSAFGPDFRLGRDAMVLECVRYRSVGGAGTRGAQAGPVWAKELPVTRQLLTEVAPSVVVTVGKDALWAMAQMFRDLEPAVPATFNLKDFYLHPLTATLSGQHTIVLPTVHLTGVWGNPDARVAAVADAIRAANAQPHPWPPDGQARPRRRATASQSADHGLGCGRRQEEPAPPAVAGRSADQPDAGRLPLAPARTVPADDAPWIEVFEFAETYDGYRHHGTEGAFASYRSLHDRWLRSRSLPDDLASVRCALFMAQRSAHWTDFDPVEEGPWIRALVSKTRDLSRGEVESGDD